MPLADYKNLVGTVANVATIGQFFSGVFVCRRIIQQGNTRNVEPTPFLGGLGLSILFTKYSLIINEQGMMPKNIMGILLNIGYLLCFYLYTEDKGKFFTALLKATAFFGFLLGYGFLEDPDKVAFRFGLITTSLITLLIAAPMIHIPEVIKKKSTETLPFPMIVSGTVVSTSWLLYGIIIENLFVQFQSGFGLILTLTQLSLFFIYPSKTIEKKKKKN